MKVRDGCLVGDSRFGFGYLLMSNPTRPGLIRSAQFLLYTTNRADSSLSGTCHIIYLAPVIHSVHT